MQVKVKTLEIIKKTIIKNCKKEKKNIELNWKFINIMQIHSSLSRRNIFLISMQ